MEAQTPEPMGTVTSRAPSEGRMKAQSPTQTLAPSEAATLFRAQSVGLEGAWRGAGGGVGLPVCTPRSRIWTVFVGGCGVVRMWGEPQRGRC